jgi:DNA-binding NtrC family response regulator
MNPKTKKTLIRDDEISIRKSLSAFFEDRSWQVLAVANGKDAIAKIKEILIEAAIVNLRLPGIRELNFISQINKSQPNMICLIQTGLPEPIIPAEIAVLPEVSPKIIAKPFAKI